MSSKFFLGMGLALVAVGVGNLLVLDVPTWLGVWNLVIGGFSIFFGVSRWLKGQ
jgi:hypothetical protein